MARPPQVIHGPRSVSESGEPTVTTAPPVVLPVATRSKKPAPILAPDGRRAHIRLQAIAANYRVILKAGKRTYGPDGPEDMPGIELQFRNHFLTLEDPDVIALAEKSPHFGPGREFWDADALAESLLARQEDELIRAIAARPDLLERARALTVKPDAEDFPPPEPQPQEPQ